MSVKSQIIQMIDVVPETELPIILEVVRHFVPTETDDIATIDDIIVHKEALAEFERGEAIAHSSINWD